MKGEIGLLATSENIFANVNGRCGLADGAKGKEQEDNVYFLAHGDL